MSKRLASACSRLLLFWTSCHSAVGVWGVTVVATGDSSPDPTPARPLNVLFLAAAKTELAAAHPGMKWLAQQRDSDGGKKYNVAYLFAAAQVLAGDGSGLLLTEKSAEENGWLLPSTSSHGTIKQEAAAPPGVRPLDANDVPRHMPAFGDHETLAKMVDSQNTNRLPLKFAYKQFDHHAGDRITQETQPPASELRELKRAGVHLIPYRLLGGPTEAFPFLTPTVYAEYVRDVVFKKEKIDLVVFDMMAVRSVTQMNPFALFRQDLLKDFFPVVEAKTFVRWAGNQSLVADSINEMSEAGAANGDRSDNDFSKNGIIVPKGPVLTATFLPKLLEQGQIGADAQLRLLPGKHGSKPTFPLYFLGENAEGKSVNVGPIGLVMQHPAVGMTSDAYQGDGGKKFAQGQQVAPNRSAAAGEDPTVQKIRDRLGSLKLDGLIYVAFGTQGNAFSQEGVRYLVRELVAASPSSLVYLVRPKMLPGAAEGADAFFRALPEEDITQGRLLVHETERAPQLKIFQAFAPKFGRFNQDESLKFSFLTHGGVGSLSEALGLSIPVLCLPLFQADQPDNCATVGRSGLGRDLGKVAMLMSLFGWMAPLMYPTPALNQMLQLRTVAKLALSATPGHQTLTGEHDSRYYNELRRFYQQADDFRAPARQKGAADAEAVKGRETDGAFLMEKVREWQQLAAEAFGNPEQGGGATGVLRAEAALLYCMKVRSNMLRAIRANLEPGTLGNTLSRDADVGPLLAQFAEMENPTAGGDADGWFNLLGEDDATASGLPGWAIALIVVGSLLVVSAVVVTVVCCCCCCRG